LVVWEPFEELRHRSGVRRFRLLELHRHLQGEGLACVGICGVVCPRRLAVQLLLRRQL
jgi:hypothetical protein